MVEVRGCVRTWQLDRSASDAKTRLAVALLVLIPSPTLALALGSNNMTTLTPTDLSFPTGELERALSEQSFGIASYEITERSALEATARVVLLEGEVVSISLTSRGYTVSRESYDHFQRNTEYDCSPPLLQVHTRAWRTCFKPQARDIGPPDSKLYSPN